MEMLNRAIEDASDFQNMVRKLESESDEKMRALRAAMAERRDPVPAQGGMFENRTQRRARERAERKAALKAESKVRAW